MNDAWCKCRKHHGIAYVEGQVGDRFIIDDQTPVGLFGVEERSFSADRDAVGYLTNLQDYINDRRLANMQIESVTNKSPEPGFLRREPIGTRIQE